MAITTTPLLGLPYAGADTDETYAVLAGLFVKDGKKLTLPEIVEKYTPTIGSVYIKAADWTAADGTADAYDAKITISGVEPNSMILLYPESNLYAERAKRLGIRAKAASGFANEDTFVIVRATGGDPTVTEGIGLVYIALRGYADWSTGLTPPAIPYATVIGVDPYIATEEGDRDDIAASQKLVTEAFTELRISLSTLSTGLADTNKALELRLKSADLPSRLDEYRAAKGLIDKTVSNLVNYYTKSQTLTKDEINAHVSAIPKFKIEVVTSLPTSNISETAVYLVKSGDDDTNLYTEYILAGGKWEKLGTQTVDLTGYATEAWVNDILAAYVKTVDMEAYVTGLLAGYLTKEDAAKTYQPAGDYPSTPEMDTAISNATKDLAPKSSVPTKISQLINDSKYITLSDGDERYEPIKQKLEEMDSEEELYERGDTTKQYIVGGYVYEYAPDEVWTQYTEYNTGLVNLCPPVNTGIKEDNSDLTYRSGVLTSGLIPFSRGWDASGDAIRALSKVVIGTKDPAKIGELKPTSMGAVTTAIGTFHYKTDGSYIGFTKASQFAYLKSADGANYADTDTIPLPEDLLLKDKNTSGISSWTSVGYVRVVLGLGTGMTDDEVANLAKNITITVPETYKETRTGKWVNTGEKAYDDEAVREVAEDVAALDVRVTATEGAIAQINEALGGEVTTVANYRAIAFVGDSITYGSGASNYGTLQAGWVGEVMTRCGYDEATSVNLGVSGAGFVQIAPAPSSVTIVDIVNAQSFAAFDDIIVSAGINDWKNTTIALADFWTNLKEVFVKLRTDNKYARLYYQLPYNCKISSWTGSTYDTHYALDYKEGGSGNYCLQHTLATFRQMIVDKINTDEDLKTLGIRIIDYMPLTRNNIDQITGDGLHPNAVGYKIIGKTIAQILNLS